MTFQIPTGGTVAFLTKVTDRYGKAVTYTNTATATSSITDSTGSRSVNFSYTSGRVTGMTESLAAGATGARSWGYAYDGGGHLTGYTDPAGKLTSFCYTGHLLTKIITPVGVASGATCATSHGGTDVTDIAYDAAGRVTSITYENGTAPFTVTFSTPKVLDKADPGTTRLVDPYSQPTDYSYDAGDRIIKTINPLGNTASATFNTNNDETASVSANNNTGGGSDPSTTATYDANNNLLTVKIPTGASASAT